MRIYSWGSHPNCYVDSQPATVWMTPVHSHQAGNSLYMDRPRRAHLILTSVKLYYTDFTRTNNFARAQAAVSNRPSFLFEGR